MSAQPVDVLAVLERARAEARCDVYQSGVGFISTLGNDLAEARAAVAELIEAVGDVYADFGRAPCVSACPTCRIRAALARCGGTS